MVGFTPGRLPGDLGIRGGVRFWKTVSSECSHELPNSLSHFRRDPLSRQRPGDEFLLQGLHLLSRVKMRHRPAQQVGIRQAESSQLVGDAQYLFLVKDHAKCIRQQRGERRVQVATHEIVFQSTSERARPVQCQGNHKIIHAASLDFPQRGAHAWAFDLKTADGATVPHDLRSGCIFVRDGIQRAEGRSKKTRIG